jgi:hypothetical protein
LPVAGWRANTLFTLGGKLYVSSVGTGVAHVGGARVAFAIPGATDDAIVARPTTYGNAVVFGARAGSQPGSANLGAFRAIIADDGEIAVSRIAIDGTAANIFAAGDACYRWPTRHHRAPRSSNRATAARHGRSARPSTSPHSRPRRLLLHRTRVQVRRAVQLTRGPTDANSRMTLVAQAPTQRE